MTELPVVAPRRRRRRWRWVGLLLMAIVGLPFLLDRPGRETIPDPRRTIPPEQNTLVAVVAAFGNEKLPALPKRLGAPTPSQEPEVLQYLADHAAVLQAIDAALALPDAAVPNVTADAQMHSGNAFRGYAQIREAARLKVAAGHLRREQGDLAGALRDHEDVIALGLKITNGGGLLLDYLVGSAIEGIGLQALRNELGPARLTPPERRLWTELVAQLLAWHDEPNAVQQALAGEYQVQRELLLNPHQMGASRWMGFPSVAYMPHQTAARCRQWIEQARRQAALPYPQRNLRVAEPPRPRGPDYLWNGLGKTLAAMMMPAVSRVVHKSTGRQALVTLTATDLALKLYADAHGKLPATLDELVTARMLPAVPVDPYSGAQMVYRPEARLLYCVGENLKDDAGRDERSDKGAGYDDVVVRLTWATK